MSSYYEKMLATGEVKCIDDEIPFEIPQGWEWVRLNSYSDVRDGTHDTPQYVVSGYPLITSKDFIGGIFDFSKTKYIDERTFIEINKRSNVQIGDILFSMIGGNIGSMILITKENYFDMAIKNVALFKHYIYNDILIKYLYLYLQSQVVSIKNTASGGAQSFVSLNMLRNYLMPIPPLNEQNRIIEKFKSLDFVIQRYEKSYRKLNNLKQELFPKLRKSILQEAIQGKLVPQLAEEGRAQELLEQIKAEKRKLVKEGKLKKSALSDSVIFRGDDNKYYEQIGQSIKHIDDEIPFEIPYNWQWTRLSYISSIYTGNSISEAKKRAKFMGVQGRYYIGTKDVGFDNKIVYDNGISIPLQYERDFRIALANSILMCIEGGSAGKKIAVLNQDVCFGNKLCCFSPFMEIGKFIYYYLQSPSFIDMFNQNKTGIIGGVSIAKVKDIVIPLPPLMEQQRIVAQIDGLFEQLR